MIVVPYLSYDAIHEQAEQFLKKFHSSRELPIPIEEIIDIQLGIHIVPRLGFHDEIGQDGSLSGDMTTITVDERVYDYVDVRYRFTLAHEIGHLILHEDLYKAYIFKAPADWKTFQASMPERERRRFEFQANCFAGLVLVPKEELHDQISDCIRTVDKEGISLKDNWDFAWFCIEDNVSKIYNVSSGTINIRMNFDKIKERYS